MTLSDLEKEILRKESHEGKSLSEHINECLKLTLDSLNFYNLDKYKEFAELLCCYHDLGKLKDSWSVNNKINPPHSPNSVFILLKTNGEKLEKYPLLPLFILKHHGSLTRVEDSDVLRVKNEASRNEKERIDNKMKNWQINLYKFVSKLDTATKVNLVDTFGLFKFADILSANNLTNYRMKEPDKNIENLESWLLDKIKKKGLIVRNKALRTQLNLNKIDDNLLIRAPTGWGKTAVSLSYALGKGLRIIYVLPTITSIKSFYSDLCAFFGEENVGELFYYADVEAIRREKSDFRELMFSSYFAQPVIITTLDQLLLTFLQVGKYFMKRPHLRNSIIILDEVHTFSQNMLYILSYFIEKFSDLYNLRFCVMSATFPSVLMEHFVNLFSGEIKKLWLDREFRDRRRVVYKLIEKRKDVSEIIEDVIKLYDSKKEKFRISIVCNTVEKSQKVFGELQRLIKNKLKSINIELLHSRFIYKHRCEKEDRITNWIKNEESFILVATQVIEVSLDISLDFMITECAPLESLVQRFGRVNRYGNRTEKTNVWITFPAELNTKKKYPYGKNDILNTWRFLKDFEGNSLKNELQLIEEYDKLAYISKMKQREMYSLLSSWEETTSFLYSWRVSDELAQRLLKFRDEFTKLVVPSVYEGEVRRLYDQIKKEISYTKKKKLFVEIKEYTVPVPIWMVKVPTEEGFPTADLFYDRIYGIRNKKHNLV